MSSIELDPHCFRLNTDEINDYNRVLNLGYFNRNPNNSYTTDMFGERNKVAFPNYDFYLRRILLKSETVNHLTDNLNTINEWCTQNVSHKNYGFYDPPECEDLTLGCIHIIDYGNILDVHRCVVFRHRDDLIAFKLRF